MLDSIPRKRPRLRRPGHVATFGLVSLVPIVVIGLVLAHFLRAQVRARALQQATTATSLIARVGIQPRLTREAMEEGLSIIRLTDLDVAIQTGPGADIARVKIWNKDREIVYSDDHSLIGRTFPPSEDLEEAFDGEVKSEMSNLDDAENEGERGLGELLEVYVPFRFEGSREPDGVFEVYLPYRPIAAAVAKDTRTLYLLLLAGLAVLYGALFRLALGASRRLRRQAQENQQQALHDALTGLPNRTLFRDRLNQAVAAARRDGHETAVMLLDLDRFKEVNDTLGHASGDLLLTELARRLCEVVRESDSIARLGGDEFALLLPRVHASSDPVEVAERITKALDEPFVLQDVPIAVEASIGIAIFPEHGGDVDTLLQRADVAMYAAKTSHGGYALYDAASDDYSPGRLRLVAELRRAIEEGELTVHYQPKEDLATAEVVGAEALVRWNHPERGLLAPGEFVPVAQHTNLIKPLTLYVLDTALAQCSAWRRDGVNLHVAVNLSSRSLLDVDLPADVARLLAKWELRGEALELEITETTIMADPLRAASVLARLNALGVRIAIDDFGTGYSSLAYLSGLPVHEIKIDRSFVTTMNESSSHAVIVRSTIDLGRNLGLEVVAEGVETADVLEALRALGCDAAQGYFLSRAVPPADLAEWLRARPVAA
ncbi:MAG: EAL domain-containing protein [Actinomycetota bacterium]|nr:EAL domain-containing protein [Actinomycetota bacterium]